MVLPQSCPADVAVSLGVAIYSRDSGSSTVVVEDWSWGSGVPNAMGALPNWNEPPDATPAVLANDGPMADFVKGDDVPSLGGLVPKEKR